MKRLLWATLAKMILSVGSLSCSVCWAFVVLIHMYILPSQTSHVSCGGCRGIKVDTRPSPIGGGYSRYSGALSKLGESTPRVRCKYSVFIVVAHAAPPIRGTRYLSTGTWEHFSILDTFRGLEKIAYLAFCSFKYQMQNAWTCEHLPSIVTVNEWTDIEKKTLPNRPVSIVFGGLPPCFLSGINTPCPPKHPGSTLVDLRDARSNGDSFSIDTGHHRSFINASSFALQPLTDSRLPRTQVPTSLVSAFSWKSLSSPHAVLNAPGYYPTRALCRIPYICARDIKAI